MSNDWIYIGADIDRKELSKIGKTTVGLEIRHTSSQSPGYFIYTAYEIISGDVGKIELELLNYIEQIYGHERIRHISTGNQTECFSINPYELVQLVESFIREYYSSSVAYDHISGEISRYQCETGFYQLFKPQLSDTVGQESNQWFDVPVAPLPQSLEMSKDKYFTGNQAEHEAGLGDNLFVDFESGMQGYRDEEGNIYWHQN